MTTALAGRRIVLDCRWLGFGGPGRVIELLLRRLGDEPPAGNWILWDARIESRRSVSATRRLRPGTATRARPWGSVTSAVSLAATSSSTPIRFGRFGRDDP